MLTGLHVRDIVVVDRLDWQIEPGLNVVTGETGAGKSVLLDALELALGARADSALVRPGAERASVTAEFALPADHPARGHCAEQGIELDETVILRRTLSRDGGSRAFVNDQPVSIGFLRELGVSAVEIQGQNDQHLLAAGPQHRRMLDAYAGLDPAIAALESDYAEFRAALDRETAVATEIAQARGEEDYLRHVLAELDALEPQPDEEAALAATRALLMDGEKIGTALDEAAALIGGDKGVQVALRSAQRALERLPASARPRFATALLALDRAAIEAQEASGEIDRELAALDLDPARLAKIEDRLFGLRDAARKHRTSVDALAALRDDFARRLAAIDSGASRLTECAARSAHARAAFLARANEIAEARRKAALRLDIAVQKELAALKLEKAVFRTAIETVPEDAWSARGTDRVTFLIATVPGAPPGPLGRVASGGELSRILLALKVVLADSGEATTLIFDEIDRGVGGATADAVGLRLARLAKTSQVVVVTHSPQVAARGQHHFRLVKTTQRGGTSVVARIERLTGSERREEIARMLAGASITDEARAAADSLISGLAPRPGRAAKAV